MSLLITGGESSLQQAVVVKRGVSGLSSQGSRAGKSARQRRRVVLVASYFLFAYRQAAQRLDTKI